MLALADLLLVLVLLASGRVSALAAGLAGLAATIAASGASPELLGREIPAGLWLSWQVIAIIAAGMFFHRCTLAAGQAEDIAGDGVTPGRLWAVCFLLAPFAEAVTGFGVGYIIALAALRRLGLGGIPALLFGLYSQSLVPWGALATGTFLEINSQPERLDLTDTHARAACEAGVRVVINSDAHHTAGLDYAELGVGQARRAWLTKAEVLNTRSWAQVEKLRKRR